MLLGSVITAQEDDLPRAALALALGHLEAALLLLDQANAPPYIGAHVDLATCQLRDLLGAGTLGDAAKSH